MDSILLNSSAVADMMKIIPHRFIETNSNKIKIKSNKWCISLIYSRDNTDFAKDIYFYFNGDGYVDVTGTDIHGNWISHRNFSCNNPEVRKVFPKIISSLFNINMEY